MARNKANKMVDKIQPNMQNQLYNESRIQLYWVKVNLWVEFKKKKFFFGSNIFLFKNFVLFNLAPLIIFSSLRHFLDVSMFLEIGK